MSYDVDPQLVARLAAICTALPEVVAETAWVGARWRVRGKTFAHVLPIVEGRPASYAKAAGTDGPAVVLTFRITEEERELFTRLGPPYWATRWGRDVGGLILDTVPVEDLDWVEIAELVTESYRLLAPRKLVEAADFDPGSISGRMTR